MKKIILLLGFIGCVNMPGMAQQKINPDTIKHKMQWFADAKLGIFIHWGIYSVNGVDESWSFYNNKISYADYMKQLEGFTASNYNPKQWADLIKETGARYAVITTKHHDGVALWPTKEHHYSVVNNTPAKKDVLNPFYEALDKNGIKRGAYFSLIDWSYPDYPGFLKDSSRYKVANDPQRWQRFQHFFQAQINEINTAYKPDLWWFDGDWEHKADEWQSEKVRSSILSLQPNAIINGRLQGYGDYETPEQNFPVSRPKFNWWELCMTTNNNWGYHPDDINYKTPFEIITIFVDAVSNGGNLLLDIGPKADGTIPDEQVHILKELGKWNKKHEESIFGTIAGLPQGHFYGPSTLSKDSTTVYLFLPGQTTGNIMLKGLDNSIKDIQVVGTSAHLQHKVVGKIS
ncbi:alpha-L-fucosidase [Solitalea sp. MAHUQ-68]|uniref:alpha-L-fucosidase n=1 Tax=Solitalea agri TaxID=2953739 RepID=A0A9X2JBD9_9SPHI|nr:alpha-L-fucosidase [Solitalea agri]MCO4292387.1 alpha-L-fucosidase [Solitalea agri]